MKEVQDRKAFYAEVYEIVKKIPRGKVLTYGQIARLIGKPQHSRMVGQALSDTPVNLRVPCHRVVNSQGRPVPSWTEQKELLTKEGITIKENGCVDLKKYLWNLF